MRWSPFLSSWQQWKVFSHSPDCDRCGVSKAMFNIYSFFHRTNEHSIRFNGEKFPSLPFWFVQSMTSILHKRYENVIPKRSEMVNRFDLKWLKMAKNFVIDLKCSYEKRRFCHKILAYRLDIQFHKGIFIMVRNIQLFKFVCANSMKLWFNAKYKILYGMSRIPMPVPLPLFNKALPQIQWSYLINNKIG